jgi:hypothetical protein
VHHDHHLVTRVRSTAVAFFPPPKPKHKHRGRPRRYGHKTWLRRWVLLCTDLTLSPWAIIRPYGWRFKIEAGFWQAIHNVGLFNHT